MKSSVRKSLLNATPDFFVAAVVKEFSEKTILIRNLLFGVVMKKEYPIFGEKKMCGKVLEEEILYRD